MNSGWQAALVGTVLALGIGGGKAAPGDWASYAGAPGGGQYSSLTQITPDNIGRLRIAWSFRTGELGAGLPDPERRRFEANPLVLGGRMYLTTGTGIAFALDATSGRELWSFDAKVPRNKHYSDPASRGVSFWRDTQATAGACRERIVYGTLDARLIALDAADGKPCAGFGKDGTIDLHAGIDVHDNASDAWSNYAVTSPPVVAGDVLVVGSSIGDNRGHALEQVVVHQLLRPHPAAALQVQRHQRVGVAVVAQALAAVVVGAGRAGRYVDQTQRRIHRQRRPGIAA
ncbi:PQQ-binding-like beta-propeller repeat protein, partial [Xanthomonas sacchari]|uniref:outer membrane protein assembly factor BamB family protein n=1 Tax=Xanthomonas sacchari TaxID=56458 RepID=UPI00224CB2AA